MTGEGGPNNPQFSKLLIALKLIWKSSNQKFKKDIRGYPNFGPSKFSVSKKEHPSTAFDLTFVLQNPFLLKKWGSLKKNRAHYAQNCLCLKKNFPVLSFKQKHQNQRIFKIKKKISLASNFPLFYGGQHFSIPFSPNNQSECHFQFCRWCLIVTSKCLRQC